MKNDIDNFIAALEQHNIYEASLVDAFRNMLEWGGSPNEGFDFIAAGAYKECYCLNNTHIIKFAACDNDSEDEMEILKAAQQAGLEALFLPTTYTALDIDSLTAIYIDEEHPNYSYYMTKNSRDETTYHRRYLPTSIMGYFIQPRITETARENPGTRFRWIRDIYNNNPVVDETGEAIPYEIIHQCSVGDLGWVQSVVDHYGSVMLYRLANFIKEYCISDLHSGNIGYIDGRPVIIDWLS